MTRPAVTCDPVRVRAWLADPDRPQELSGLDVADADVCYYPDYDDGQLFIANVEELVDAADDAGLFGDQASLSVRPTTDHDGLFDGAYLLIDVPRHRPDGGTGRVRFASLYQQPADLIDNPDATGHAAAVAILHAVARTAADVLADAWYVLDRLPPT